MKTINWHRLFGIMLTFCFKRTPFEVRLEEDLTLKQQFLDVLIVRKQQRKLRKKLPDGLENMADYNLLSYKSIREPFDAWAMKELVSHYVSYRKQISLDGNDLLPEDKFQLYAISTRFPQNLSKQVSLREVSKGIYQVLWGTDEIRLIVLSKVPKEKQNAIWKLFSGNPEDFRFAARLLRRKMVGVSQAINQVFEHYELEGIDMPYTLEDFERDYIIGHMDQFLKGVPISEKLKGVPISERLKGVSTSEILKELSPEEIKEYLKQLEEKES